MKKFAIILLSIALIVASIALVACTVDPDTCNHQWGEWEVTTPATCTADGVETRTCAICEKQETQSIDALGHKILDDTGAQKSCRGVNLTAGLNCSVCNELVTGDDLIQALYHKTLWAIKAVDPTCTNSGLTEGKKCLNCNNIIVAQEVVDPIPHEEVEVPAVEVSCTRTGYTAGTMCARCGRYISGHEQYGEPLGHDFSHGNYFTYVECIRECGSYGKLTGGDPFETEFIYDFDDAKKEEIDILYETLIAVLDGTNSQYDFDGFVELFEEYDEAVGYIQAQYQFARVLNDIEYNTKSRAAFNALSEYYNTTIARYYGLFKAIDNSTFAAQFWAETEWDDEYIKYVLSLADSYNEDSRNEVDEILDAYEDLLSTFPSAKDPDYQEALLSLFDLYSQLVAANNNIAVTAGYDNYMEYAYERVYERDYSPEDVADMRKLVKEYIGPVIADVANAYEAWNDRYLARGGWTNLASQLYYSQFVNHAMWANPNNNLSNPEGLGMILNSRQNVSDYFSFLSDGDESVDFYGALQDVFASGNVFLGNNTNITAYTWYIYQTGTPILVFGGATDSNGSYSYRDAFTFVHEFGHYYQFAHNGRLSVPMDHDETQSQGNEMLFLAWLYANMPEGVEEGFELLELEQLINMLGSIVLSTAVDEFEYLVYTGATTFDGKPIPMIDEDLIDYATLYKVILESYWEDIGSWFNVNYWMYVTFDNAAYYISYAMSALPCLELYAKAGNDGLEAARASYLKLFTFSSNEEFLAEDSFGDMYVSATYEEILNWAGLGGPFQEELYESIVEFFEGR